MTGNRRVVNSKSRQRAFDDSSIRKFDNSIRRYHNQHSTIRQFDNGHSISRQRAFDSTIQQRTLHDLTIQRFDIGLSTTRYFEDSTTGILASCVTFSALRCVVFLDQFWVGAFVRPLVRVYHRSIRFYSSRTLISLFTLSVV